MGIHSENCKYSHGQSRPNLFFTAHKKETVKDVLEEIEACKYSQFDPDLAEIFIKSRPGAIGKSRD